MVAESTTEAWWVFLCGDTHLWTQAHQENVVPSYYMSEDLARFGDIAKTDPARFDLFLKWYQSVMEPGALDGKTKKLIAYAVANAIQEPYCIDSYTSACADVDISPEELAEALLVAAAIRGGGTIAHWAQTLNTMSRKG